MKNVAQLIFISLFILASLSQCKDSINDSNIESTAGKTSEVGSKTAIDDNQKQTATIDLEWERIKEAKSYKIQISTNKDFSDKIVDSPVAKTSYTATGLSYSTKYYWKVYGKIDNNRGSWTEVENFTIEPEVEEASISGAKSSSGITLSSPKNEADKVSTNLTFKWTEVSGHDDYIYQLTDNKDFTSTILIEEVSGTSYTPDVLVPRKKYYWRVKADGENQKWSEPRSFTTGAGGDDNSTTENSALISPENGADKTSTELTFKWNKVSGYDDYIYQLTDNKDFTSTILVKEVSGTSYAPDVLIPRKKYYWRVKADGKGQEWSDARSFTTGNGTTDNETSDSGNDGESSNRTPTAVTLNSPTDNADKVSTNLKFKWKEVSGYDKYVYQLTDNKNFTSTILVKTVSGTSYEPDVLTPRKKYYWRVKVDDKNAKWSETRSFKTGAGHYDDGAGSGNDDGDDSGDSGAGDDGKSGGDGDGDGGFAPPTSSPPPSINGFVGIQNGNFVLDGEIFRFVGTNAYYLPNYEKLNSAVVDRAFDLFRETDVRVVRMWGFYDGYDCGYSQHDDSENVIQTAPGKYNESALRDLDRVIAKGKKSGVRFIIPFINYWDELGGICQYNTWAGASNPSTNMDFFLNNSETQKWFKNYISMLLNRTNTVTGVKYKDEPAIMAWQIMNEGRNSSQDPKILRNWYREIAQYIKSIDSKHLLSTGEEGFDEGTPSQYSAGEYSNTYALRAQEGTSYVLNTAIPEIDFGSAHWYPADYGFGHNMNGSLLDAQKAWISDHKKIAEKHGKPFYIGEYGIAGWGDSRVSEMYDAFSQYAKSVKLDGSLIWQLTADGTKCFEFGGNICYPGGRNDTSLYNSFKDFVRKMNGSTSD